ncbi:MAG TPA: amino acid permease [Methylomirabilota bacterium]|nr:amino acid permease [Methylomirabilota bacterium]
MMLVARPDPTLRVIDVVAIIVGTVVGAGIFRTPSLVAANAPSEAVALGAWAAGGAVSLVGALCYAELAAAYPSPGGDYHYLARAFGVRLAFLFAWARITVIQTGSIALLAFVIGDYATKLAPLGAASPTIYAALTVAVITGVHVVGVRQGRLIQNLLTGAEVAGLLLVITAGFALGTPSSATPPVAVASTQGFGLMMVFVLLTYGGWNEAAYASAEIRGPRGSIVRALVWGIVAITALYLLVNVAYLRGLGLAGMAESKTVAADLMARAAGVGSAWVVSALIVIAAATSVNAAVFTGARTAYALGRDFRPLAFLGRWHRRAGTPVNALVVQGAIALALVLLGGFMREGFETMVEFTAPVFWLFFLLTGVSLFVLRHREPEVARPFTVPLYPLTPLVFCATCAYLLYASLAYSGTGSVVGVAVVAAGALVLGVMGRGAANRPDTQGGS